MFLALMGPLTFVVAAQSLSHCPTLYSMDCSTPSPLCPLQAPEFAQIQVYWSSRACRDGWNHTRLAKVSICIVICSIYVNTYSLS